MRFRILASEALKEMDRIVDKFHGNFDGVIGIKQMFKDFKAARGNTKQTMNERIRLGSASHDSICVTPKGRNE